MLLLLIILSLNSTISYLRSKPMNWYLKGSFTPVTKERNILIHNIDKNSKFSKISGFYGQIGSNPRIKYESDNVPGYHWFDGDGMIHGLFFKKNSPIQYQNKWIKTKRFQVESRMKQKMYINFGELRGLEGILAIMKNLLYQEFALISHSKGTANTAISHWNNRTFAHHEGDQPYEISINNYNIKTLDRCNFDHAYSITAHPKYDNNRNNAYFYSYNNYDFSEGLFCMRQLDKNYNIINAYNLSLVNNGMVHDIGETVNHLIIPDLPLQYDFNEILHNRVPLIFKKNETSRFGIVHKDQKNNETDWYELSKSVFIFHFAECYETTNDYIIYACVMNDLDMNDFVHLDNPEHSIRGDLRLQKIICDKKTKKARLEKNNYIEHLRLKYKYNIDFPIMSNTKSDLVYCTIFDACDGTIKGLLKHNLSDFHSKPVLYKLNNLKICSEPSIVNIDDKEYLLSFTYDNKNNSYITLFDLSSDVLNTESIKLPNDIRVPPGFHSIFIPNNNVKNQVDYIYNFHFDTN